MKPLKHWEPLLPHLTWTALLGCVGLELAALALGGSAPLSCLSLFCGAAAAGLLAAVRRGDRRRLAALEQSHQESLAALEQTHTRAMIDLRAQNQKEMARFRSDLSHSLRMPVAIIQGYADLLSGGVVTDPVSAMEYLNKISERCQYMTEAMSRQFSAADSIDSSKLAYSDLDLLSLVRQTAADMQSAAEAKEVRIQVVSPETSLPMRGDAYLLNRVLYNLLENALKYMGRPGTVTIRVLREGENASLLVQDDGMGLSAKETEHIFEANYQGSNHTGGQGYGLYLVRRAIEAHGGSVSAQSAPGRGMGISMILPLMPKAEAAAV